MPTRPIPLLAIAVVDYLVWRWSSASGPQAVALVSGIALLPLVLATLVLGVGAVMRRAARGTVSAPRSHPAQDDGDRTERDGVEETKRIAA